jgi:hypothetical protein
MTMDTNTIWTGFEIGLGFVGALAALVLGWMALMGGLSAAGGIAEVAGKHPWWTLLIGEAVLLFLGFRVGVAMAIAKNDAQLGGAWFALSMLIGLVWLIVALVLAAKRYQARKRAARA